MRTYIYSVRFVMHGYDNKKYRIHAVNQKEALTKLIDMVCNVSAYRIDTIHMHDCSEGKWGEEGEEKS